jgi:hypothetical protein
MRPLARNAKGDRDWGGRFIHLNFSDTGLAALPVRHEHAAGIDVGDTSHGACVDPAPDGADPVRPFPAHTPRRRQPADGLRPCGVPTVALQASGAYGHVLFQALRGAGCPVVLTATPFARPIQGRPQTGHRDGPWIQRLHQHGLLPPIFQHDEATQTLRDSVRQRANLVRDGERNKR